MSERPKIIVVGGGAAGLELATRLGRKLGKPGRAEVTLIDATRSHVWKPLLHQVAAGTFDPAQHALGYLAHARWNHYRFRLGVMSDLDRVGRKVILAPLYNDKNEELIPSRSFAYDYLIFAVGSVSNDFGVPGVQEHCLMLDTKSQASAFQQQLLEALIRANTQHEPLQEGQLDVAIVGAGATGVELAAQLHQVTRQISQYGFEIIDPDRHVRLHILDAGPRILPALPEKLSGQVQLELEGLGIQVHVSETVTEVTAEGVHTASGQVIPAAIKVWAAGIKGPDFLGKLGLSANRINQLKVNGDLTLEDDDRLYAIGDCAACVMNEQGDLVPPRAQAAHQQASFVAKALERRIKGHSFNKRYVYRDYGSLVTLGRYSTVGSLMGAITGSVRVSGWIARWVYLSLYKMHQLTLFGWWRTGLTTLARMLRRSIDPAIKLH
ncbi:MAG: NAD(P)/FAD-dependent oxidoreductase [gamma proteobacterium symbiont of Clathrolucina costata]|uniref:NAD(P)/FAD-dependent oxidoreductase n=1 Tax=Candidatus Thiodiazotropha taylori TaxID=2792791 RepID=A0A9E4TTE9_9GAMM|nr:NAD(P)/FAD-dependent oxidoreductase [Candidatus Thiodiazotropha sp. (ex Lucina pensylvanica)]MBT3051861.1 NAD(P)/FAD-dependent oxidoreductase [Candidatus Thiodiazotropha sp. (ex Codakia orbicularis)]MBT3056324.1 NAD(P)/FAD-dependent oxidoreductase [Candidatus Thiodiazotropha sp. (ex Codakia orbicularis)]MCG7978717.1 NAD(P)/FAD-dependent oxidoreductase [Candidatus Thiodiazotropha taylori]MCW4236850.1 NAD(P)/FAD-dependent oxidoreductase [Candidatus Thiodiazotropha endolucinida]